MKYDLKNRATGVVAKYDENTDLWYRQDEPDNMNGHHDWQLLETGQWEVITHQPPFYSDKNWESLVSAYQAFYFSDEHNKERHPAQAFSDGIQHGVRWIGFFFAHWAEQQGYTSFLGIQEGTDLLQLKWSNKDGFPISADDLYKKFCEYAKTVF